MDLEVPDLLWTLLLKNQTKSVLVAVSFEVESGVNADEAVGPVRWRQEFLPPYFCVPSMSDSLEVEVLYPT